MNETVNEAIQTQKLNKQRSIINDQKKKKDAMASKIGNAFNNLFKSQVQIAEVQESQRRKTTIKKKSDKKPTIGESGGTDKKRPSLSP